MNIRFVLWYLGLLWIGLAVTMLGALAVSLIYGEHAVAMALLKSQGIAVGLGILAYVVGRKEEGDFFRREGLAVVGFGWLTAAGLGALPFLISGVIPSIVDAYFESMSGFTTTGASLLTNIEEMPRGLLFWRSFTHWLGGIGIIVLFVALLPALGAEGKHMYRVEIPGLKKEGLRPRIREAALVLWKIYALLSLAEVALLMLAGLNWFEALCHTFGTVATGGFSTLNQSIGGYHDPFIEGIIVVFMVLAGVNFSLYYTLFQGGRDNVRSVLKDAELRTYLLVLTVACAVLVGALVIQQGDVFRLVGDSEHAGAIRVALFQTIAIHTTTGYSTADFTLWPLFCQFLLVWLMLMGGCAGSTGGGIKVYRVMIIVKYAYRELYRFFQPKVVRALRVGPAPIDDEHLRAVMGFLALFSLIFCAATMVLTFLGMDLVTAATAAISALCNIGPGLGDVGPSGNYAFVHPAGKVLLALLMMMGRLELYTALVLFLPSFWRK